MPPALRPSSAPFQKVPYLCVCHGTLGLRLGRRLALSWTCYCASVIETSHGIASAARVTDIGIFGCSYFPRLVVWRYGAEPVVRSEEVRRGLAHLFQADPAEWSDCRRRKNSFAIAWLCSIWRRRILGQVERSGCSVLGIGRYQISGLGYQWTSLTRSPTVVRSARTPPLL